MAENLQEALLRRAHQDLESGDRERVLSALRQDVVWREPRPRKPTARYKGRRGVAGLLAAITLLAGLAVAGSGVAWGSTGTVTTYTDPANNIFGPNEITAGPDGNLWFTSNINNRIGKITPTGTITTYTDPANNINGPIGITAGPDGNLWFTSNGNNRIGKITPTGTITTYTDPLNNISLPTGITAGSDGNLWFTSYGNNRIGKITPTGTITTYTDPLNNISAPVGITAGSDGNLWFTSNINNRIGKITPTGTITTYTDPANNINSPGGITTGTDGNLWFTSGGNNRIGEITPTGIITTYTDPLNNVSLPVGITTGPDGNLWFTNLNNNRIGKITPTGTITTYTDPANNINGPNWITAGPDGNLWFTNFNNNRIGKIAPLGPAPVRLFGADAIATALAVSQAEFPSTGSASAVVLARSDFFSDALAGGPLAAKVNGPLLITPGASSSSSLDPRVQAEIQRVLKPGGTVYILGGPVALSPTIDTTLTGLGYTTQRVQGSNEFATAVAIANQLGNPSTIFEATGLNFPDALSAVPAAIATGGAILLNNGTSEAPETAAYLTANPPSTRYVVGGPVTNYQDPMAIPVYGADLFGTSAAVAALFFSSPAVFGTATGATYPDALSGGVFMATAGRLGPLLLVNPSGPLPSSIAAYLGGLAESTQGYIFGGPVAVGPDVAAEIQAST